MFIQRGQFGAAKASYQRVDVSSRVEGANAHQLVTILYDELLKSIDAMALAAERNDWKQRSERLGRALRLISGLETSLDFDQGGDIAIDLARIYREGRRLLVAGGRDNDVGQIRQARDMLATIADAWSQIGAA